MSDTSRKNPRRRILALGIGVLVSLVLLEGVSRLAYAFKEEILFRFGGNPPILNREYKVADPAHPGHWRLRPGFSETLEQAIEAAKQKGEILREKLLRELLEAGSELGIAGDTLVYAINQDGFKGPEIDHQHTRLRILCIGDSCTFGSPLDEYTYPRTMERELRGAGHDVEVVNGGVQGYSPRNVLFRLDEFKALRPEITTIYIGWNQLFGRSEAEALGGDGNLYSLKIIRSLYRRATRAPQTQALEAYNKPKNPDRDAPEVKRLDAYVPSFMDQVEEIVKEMQSAGGLVLLVTLPGIYSMDEEPSQASLEKGHVPDFTDNPYVLARMAERYNAALRELAERNGLQVIDLEKWARTALQPREGFFFDSVHLYDKGQVMIGEYMARAVTSAVKAIEANRKESRAAE